jgi:hypothetical protein
VNPKYPIFIPSKGRWESRLTSKALDRIGVPYICVVEPQELEAYSAVMDSKKLIVLPFSNRGLVPTRNWIWDYAAKEGYPYFWTMDDNISKFYRYNKNQIIPVADGSILRAVEDFTTRYENVAISGLHYEMWVFRRASGAPLAINTRVYSNMFIRTDIPYRNRGVYNDDTDLCLRVLKDGWCTILFRAFLAKKIATMKLKGGMTPFYQGDGRLKMAQELQRAHPDVTKITWKWGRWQHQVDYRPFKGNLLKLKPGITIPDQPNEYGMKLIQL